MASIEEKRHQRDNFLIELYSRVESERNGTLAMVEESAIASSLGLDAAEADVISRYLVDQGYARFPVMGAVVSITALGVNRAEEILEEHERDASALAATLVLTTEERRDLEAAIRPLREAIDSGKIPLAADELTELEEDVKALEGQLRSPRPKREIVRGALRSVADFCNKPVVAGVLSSSAVAGVFELLRRLH